MGGKKSRIIEYFGNKKLTHCRGCLGDEEKLARV